MTLPVFLRPEATADAQEICDALNAVVPGLGNKFVSRLQDRLVLIAEFPQAFAIIWRNVRATKLKKFTYVIYYRVQTERIEVLAVVHGNRDAASWKARA